LQLSRAAERLPKIDEVRSSVSFFTFFLHHKTLIADSRIESPVTQLQTFKSLVMLTTRYPGLRRLFLRFENVRRATTHVAIADLWKRADGLCTLEWHYFRQFAASCLSDGDISITLEEIPPRELGCVCSDERGAIDKLLLVLDCE
jgi:hypothetical protein